MYITCTDVTCLLSIDRRIHKRAFACAFLYHSMFLYRFSPESLKIPATLIELELIFAFQNE